MRESIQTSGNDQVVHTIHSSEGILRNKALDLFRTLSMLFVVVQHSIVHGLNLSQLKSGAVEGTGFSLFILNGLVVIGVNGFFLLSGFFGIKEIKPSEALQIVLIIINALIIMTLAILIDFLVKRTLRQLISRRT